MNIISKIRKFWKKAKLRIRKKIIFRPPFSYDYTFKIMLLGEPEVGKKALAERFCFNIFNPSERFTVGVDFYVKTMELQGKKIKLQIWEIGGEERFKFLLPTYCLGANAAMIMFDITNSKSLNQISELIQILREKANNIPIMLIGSKLDLQGVRELNKEEGIEIVKKYNLSSYCEISTKTGKNVEKTFETLTEILINE
ncbi:MAG: Rab family GTPase [Promethearchaeota archaeon]|jgi:small GTP-binding protein